MSVKNKASVKVGHLPRSLTPSTNTGRGEWYVARRFTDEDGSDAQEYLHSDGVWRKSTFSGESRGYPTGYFASEEEAAAALAKSKGDAP